jgi:hypothetical protein
MPGQVLKKGITPEVQVSGVAISARPEIPKIAGFHLPLTFKNADKISIEACRNMSSRKAS